MYCIYAHLFYALRNIHNMCDCSAIHDYARDQNIYNARGGRENNLDSPFTLFSIHKQLTTTSVTPSKSSSATNAIVSPLAPMKLVLTNQYVIA